VVRLAQQTSVCGKALDSYTETDDGISEPRFDILLEWVNIGLHYRYQQVAIDHSRFTITAMFHETILRYTTHEAIAAQDSGPAISRA
jgi:hypothetical protein